MLNRISIKLAVIILLLGCKNNSEKTLEVSGKIVNAPATMVYLDQVPAASMQRIAVDSMRLGKDGTYKLRTERKEASLYNLRIGREQIPFINDSSKITIDANFNNAEAVFAVSTSVKGSLASDELHDFVTKFTEGLHSVYLAGRKYDSLTKTGATDSILSVVKFERKIAAEALRAMTSQAIDKSQNPALTLFELGYFQSAANEQRFGIDAFSNEEVSQIINDEAEQFPNHQGLSTIKDAMDYQMKKMTGWVGQQAPEFKLPDVNGKEISLSSFRGKYVLIDFWASWCGPCRRENPNVVSVYQKFKDRNFDILGVSFDRPDGKDNWTEAIKEDHLNWTQVSDLQYWESPIAALYRIEGIPYNVLVDPEGKVVAEGLHGHNLERKLSEFIK